MAALSLGVDLGFGQPMEHVLRQCLIALRLAERIGLDEEQRAVVYYTALLVNVGCHTDAHEQAKWFGDDIALKSGKYDHEFRSVRAAAAAMRLLGSGNPPLHRFRRRARVRALRPPRAGRDDRAPRGASRGSSAEQLGLPDAVRDALGGGLRAVGRPRLAGRARGRGGPGRGEARAAGGVRRGRPPRRRRGGGARRSRESAAGKQFDPDARRARRARTGR